MNARRFVLFATIAFAASASAGTEPSGSAPGPSRPPEEGCAWEKLADATLGLEVWAQRCDFGFRRVDFHFVQGALASRFSDADGSSDRVVEVFDLTPGETAVVGIRRLFAARTEKSLAARCVVARYDDGLSPAPAGVERYALVPDAAYARELAATADPDEIGDPPCGDWGAVPDAIQYFEAQPSSGARRVLFVRVGQDTPLFDEQTLRLLPPR